VIALLVLCKCVSEGRGRTRMRREKRRGGEEKRGVKEGEG
jgi:hypothetical protein